MQLDVAIMRKLDLNGCAAPITNGHLDRLPPLLLDRCLSDAHSKLIASTVASFTAGLTIPSETLTMPRKGFGPRPVTVISPGARLVYSALVEAIKSELPAPSRRPENWDVHEALGHPREDAEEYLVEFDIASCYEYIDHRILEEELVLRTMDAARARAVVGVLGDIFPTRRGLPQLITASDHLADTYLEIMERDLLRKNSTVSRYVDDFRIICQDWALANEMIEDAAESARSLGMILASDKSFIWKSSTLRERNTEAAAFLQRYFSDANEALTIIRALWTDYGDSDEAEVIEPAEEEVIHEALRRIFEDWYRAQDPSSPEARPSAHLQHLSAALGILSKDGERLPDEWLTELVFRQPLRLQNVALYLQERPEGRENWRTLSLLTSMKRQSPWSKVWMLSVASEQISQVEASEEELKVLQWASAQLNDKHEIVRSEAAWHLAKRNAVSEDQLAVTYRNASLLTRPALAAACAAARLASKSGLVKSVKQDSQLMAAAFEWGSPE